MDFFYHQMYRKYQSRSKMIHLLLVVVMVVGQVRVQAAFIPVEYATDATWIWWTST